MKAIAVQAPPGDDKVMVGTVNAARTDFVAGVDDLIKGPVSIYPGWLARLLTHKVEGLERYEEMLDLLESGEGIQVFVEVRPLSAPEGALDQRSSSARAGAPSDPTSFSGAQTS